MTGFDFDSPPSPGTNRSAAVTDCPTCGGDRLVLADATTDTYARCPDCNRGPAPVERPPVEADAWWKE